MRALNHYHRIQEADLYAHFSPVEFIMDEKLLKTDDFKDHLGDTSIWDRLKKLGEDRFYRVQYKRNETDDEPSSEQKRIKEKEYVEGKGIDRKVLTNIADDPYIANVLKAYVDGDLNAEKELYHEPTKSDKEIQRIQKLFGSDAKNEVKKQLLKDLEIKKDNTRVVIPLIPKIPPKK